MADAIVDGTGTTGANMKVNTDGSINTKTELNVGDIEIGAVEIKNHDTDDRVEVDTNNAMKTKISQSGDDVSTQNPLSTNGDSVYTKDIKNSLDDIGTFTGTINSLFNNLDDTIIDSSATDPKYFKFFLERPVNASSIGINTSTGNYSNVKIILSDRAGNVIDIIDDSSSDTKHTARGYSFSAKNFCCIEIQFHTTDTVTVGGVYIRKSLSTSISFIEGIVSSKNSSDVLLGIDGVFTGIKESVKDYGVIGIAVWADEDSAIDGLEIQFSTDGTNWDHTDNYTIGANVGKTYSFQPAAQFFRVVYTNGGTAQTGFRLQSILHPTYVKPSSHRVGDLISPEDDAELNKSVLTAQKPDGDFTPIDATAGGNLKVAIEEFDDAANPIRKDLEGVGDLAVGTSEVEIAITGTPTHSIRIQADNTNTGIIYIGKTGVLSDGSNDFVRLESGDDVTIDYDDVDNGLYAISDTASQKINVGVLL